MLPGCAFFLSHISPKAVKSSRNSSSEVAAKPGRGSKGALPVHFIDHSVGHTLPAAAWLGRASEEQDQRTAGSFGDAQPSHHFKY